MIVVGVDPGSRDTGVAVVDDSTAIPDSLLASFTVHRPEGDGLPLLYVPPTYLVDVLATITTAILDFRPELVSVERIERPQWRVKGKVKPLDPAGIMATAIVFGAIMGRVWTVPTVAVRARGNGRQLPLTRYPAPLATTGKGHDKRRHERAAYDVAQQGRAASRFSGQGYAP